MKLANNDAIFIVNKDTRWLVFMSRMLTGLGYTNISTYANGDKCFAHLHLKPRLIFLDHDVNMAHGVELLPLIKQRQPNTAVVLCSGEYNIGVVITAAKKDSFDGVLKSLRSAEALSILINEMNEDGTFPDKIY